MGTFKIIRRQFTLQALKEFKNPLEVQNKN